jgi:opacity protein-like surface antigen
MLTCNSWMRPRTLRSALLLTALSALAPWALSQALPSDAKTWDLYGGVSYAQAFNPSSHEFGWDASVSERPYISHPWVGGTIDTSGNYSTSTTTASGVTVASRTQLYTLMAGPSAVLLTHRIHPFARALFGAGIIASQTTATASGVSVDSTTGHVTHFAAALGGGVDVPITPNWSFRGQADWLRTYISATNTSNLLRASAGFVLRF